MKKRAHYLQHAPFEGIGSIESWLMKAGYMISATQFHESPSLPKVGDVDLVIVMGGPMSVNDEDIYPWLATEKQFIHDLITAGKPVLGICLGAQLIANALGARVYKNPVKEIGWFPVTGISSRHDSHFTFPSSINVFHWHGETFDLPPGAIHLARSEACEYQAFQIGSSVMGLQFHLETTPESARVFILNGRDELQLAPYIQSESSLLAVPPEQYRAINNLMSDVLGYLTSSKCDP